ncbi:MAG: hypothetical protein HY902_08175 [Deltaproteobacteria bacterium]|nr:hypothetical protein [Deltaproteobacteria bacterium]
MQKRWMVVATAAAMACGGAPAAPDSTQAPSRTEELRTSLPRAEFNARAVAAGLPLFWRADANGNQVLDPDELALVHGAPGGPRSRWLDGRGPTPHLYSKLAELEKDTRPTSASEAEALRQEAVRLELRQGRPTLLHSDLRDLSPGEKTMVSKLLAAADRIELLHARQLGTAGLADQIPSEDTASRALLYRNQSPWCEAPATERDPNCNALASRPPKRSGLYPLDLQANSKFCEELAAHPDHTALLDPFTVVVRDAAGKLVAQPFHVAYAADMAAVADLLEQAAAAEDRPDEAPLRAYLKAAAQAFRDGNWQPADEAWAAMSATNSKWYLRIAPDEVYYEPCSRKAGFAFTLARIDQGSLQWQQKLDPLKAEMEALLAKLAGPPYTPRKVDFHLPDFIQIVLNKGEARAALGATVGQSLPNWGPVANEGRGRTVAMANIGTDPDSRAQWQQQTASLLCQAAMADFVTDPGPRQMSTVLHEAGHNLGPAHEYRVDGKKDGEIFGGGLASMLEELKAQTIALYLTDWLVGKGVIDEKLARRAHLGDISWGFGHISSGMVDADGRPKPYSQLAAVQLGSLLQSGALQWRASEVAANGKDVGCFEVDRAKLSPAIAALMAQVAGIKARGDKPAALALRKQMVEDPGPWADLRKIIADRWLRAPKASYLYAIEL